MELKKKTIIWEDNNEPPKNYIWVKSDGKAYEFDYDDRKWKESQIVSSINSGNGGGDSVYDDFVAKDWVSVEIVTVEQYKEGRASIEYAIAEENIPEGSTIVALCSMNRGGIIKPKSVYVFGLSETEIAAYKYNNLSLLSSDIPTNAVLTVKKSQREVGEGAEAYTEDVFELLDGATGYSLEINLDFTDSDTFYVGGWVPESASGTLNPESSYIWDQLTEDKVVTGDDLDWLVVDNMAPSESIKWYRGYISKVIKDSAEKVYNVGNIYLAKLEVTNNNFKIPILVPLIRGRAL